MWKEPAATEPGKSTATAATGKPVTEDELHAILDRLETTRDIFRQHQELRDVLFRREAETQTLRARNAELEEMLQRFAPVLLNMATTMGLAAKNEAPVEAERG
jgi:hypothetical protein